MGPPFIEGGLNLLPAASPETHPRSAECAAHGLAQGATSRGSIPSTYLGRFKMKDR